MRLHNVIVYFRSLVLYFLKMIIYSICQLFRDFAFAKSYLISRNSRASIETWFEYSTLASGRGTILIVVSHHADRTLVHCACFLTNKDHPVPKFVARIANSIVNYINSQWYLCFDCASDFAEWPNPMARTNLECRFLVDITHHGHTIIRHPLKKAWDQSEMWCLVHRCDQGCKVM